MRMVHISAAFFLLCFSVAMVFVSQVCGAEWAYVGEVGGLKIYYANSTKPFEEHGIRGKRVWTRAEYPRFDRYVLSEYSCSEKIYRSLGIFQVDKERNGEFDKGPYFPDNSVWTRIHQNTSLEKVQKAVCQ